MNKSSGFQKHLSSENGSTFVFGCDVDKQLVFSNVDFLTWNLQFKVATTLLKIVIYILQCIFKDLI